MHNLHARFGGDPGTRGECAALHGHSKHRDTTETMSNLQSDSRLAGTGHEFNTNNAQVTGPVRRGFQATGRVYCPEVKFKILPCIPKPCKVCKLTLDWLEEVIDSTLTMHRLYAWVSAYAGARGQFAALH